MIKFLARKYYSILIVILAYFLFNITIRDPLINWIYNINPNESVTNAVADLKAERLTAVISFVLLVCLLFITIASIILFVMPERRIINRGILIVVPLSVMLLFFMIMSVGGFVGCWDNLKRLFF